MLQSDRPEYVDLPPDAAGKWCNLEGIWRLVDSPIQVPLFKAPKICVSVRMMDFEPYDLIHASFWLIMLRPVEHNFISDYNLKWGPGNSACE